MEQPEALHLLRSMIDYFEAGNRETAAAAKDIVACDFDYREHWRATIAELQRGVEWTGLRAPEAEIVARARRLLRELLARPPADPGK